MSYEEFERLNCKHIQELNEQRRDIQEHQNINDIVVQYKSDVDIENDLLRQPFKVQGSCALKGIQNNDVSLCHGYDCPTTNFYQTPDKLNTYHNYLVLQDDLINNVPVACIENHQYFNNWTKRKIPAFKEDKQAANMDFLDQYLRPIPLVRMAPCKLDKQAYKC